MIIGLAGNQNCGKTTLFNGLTGASARIGNFPGVTVEYQTGQVKGRPSVTVMDLPGVYSLTPYSQEEEVTGQALQKVDGMINVVDATNLPRNLYLTLQLTELGIPMVLALNMMDEVGDNAIDCGKLSKELHIPVIGISSRKKQGLQELMTAVCQQVESGAVTRPVVPVRRGDTYLQTARRRYEYIEWLCRECIRPVANKKTTTQRADALLLHSKGALPLCGGVLFLLFFLAFGPLAKAGQDWLEQGFWWLGEWILKMGLSAPLDSLVREGILRGVGSVLSFLPSIFLLFFGLSLLEDSGYLARMTFLADKPMQTIGLSGRAVVPCLTGFGCTVGAVSAAKTMPSQRDKWLTVLFLPFVSCSAKLPVYTVVTQGVFPRFGFLVILLLYLSGILWGVLNTAFSHEFLMRGKSESFVMELPAYRMPDGRYCLRYALLRCGEFIKKAFTVIFLASLLIWGFQHLTLTGSFTFSFDQSILMRWGQAVAPFFEPLGFGNAQTAAALLAGLGAKEAVVSTLSVLTSNISALFTPLSAFSFLNFVLLYMPCMASFAAVRRELGTTSAVLAFLYQTGFAWLVSFGIYQIGIRVI